MTTTEALEILKQYQAWRRGADTEMLEPKDIGKAIDIAIDALKRTQWQPIETAPKDGTRVLLFRTEWEEAMAVCFYRNSLDEWTTAAGGCVFIDPTHWMPLPPAP